MAKKNLRVIPTSIASRLKKMTARNVVAACSRVYSARELATGALKHVGIYMANGTLSFPETVIPPENQGKYSYWNVNGKEVIRRDLPKETHYNQIETPNWGDRYYGTHTVDLPYEKYPRDFIAPSLTQLKVVCRGPEPQAGSSLIIFEVDRVLDRRAKSFDADLLVCLNLLQENVGCCDVHPSGSTLEDYLQTLRVAWEVLPPGSREEAIARVFRGQTPSAQERAAIEERYDFLMSLKPAKLVYGLSGLERYFGGLIREDLVVFENVKYGNAIYIMFENWRELSQRTRTELQSGRFGRNFERVLHKSGWKGEVRGIIRKRLER